MVKNYTNEKRGFMDITKRNDLIKLVNNTIDSMIQELEEGRYHPSVREAGTAPSESAIDAVYGMFYELITKIGVEYGAVNMCELSMPIEFTDVLEKINPDNADEYDDIKKIASFTRDNGERKYRYDNIIYEHVSGRFICLEIQKTADGEVVLSHRAQETERMQKITNIWV